MSTIGVFGNLGSDAIVLSGAAAFDFFNANTILLEGISVSEIGVGLAYSADDFIF